MGGGTGIVRGVALVAFAIGALALALGAARIGRRLIAFAIVLVAVEPLLDAGLARLHRMEVIHGHELDTFVLALSLVVVALAGLVAVRRTAARSKSAEATSQKKRVERAP